jgi:hypothetical protein
MPSSKLLKSSLILLCLLFSYSDGFSQMVRRKKSNNYYSQAWKRNRQELQFSMGATNFLGELGGRNTVGSGFVKDLDVAMARPAMSVGYLYRIRPQSKIRTALTWGVLRGDDRMTQEEFRNNRNLHFRANIIEFSGVWEYYISKESSVFHKYRLKGVRGMKESYPNPNYYFFGGIAGLYHNPQALYDGKWVNLQPLGTEGQGLPGMPAKYSRLNLAIPMGFGARYHFDKDWRIGFEVGYRLTFTDYLDDVSTNYYDNAELRRVRGDVAANVADPNLGRHPIQLDRTTGRSKAGIQRGDPRDNDSYFFLMINMTYTLPHRGTMFKYY